MVYYALRGRNWTFHVECDVSSINRRRVPYHSRLFRPLAVYHIFHNTDTYSLFSLYKRGGIESKAFKNKNFEKKSAKNVWKKNFGKKIWKKNFGKINYKTKIFISKIYSNIEKCHTIFSSVAPFDKTGRFERSREKRYITACELSVTRLLHERYRFIGGTKF